MRLLLVVDMQNDFITGSLGTGEAQRIVAAVNNKIKEYKNAGDKIIFTRDTHGEGYLSTQEGRRLPVPHCVKDTPGWEITGAIDTSAGEIWDKGAFGSVETAEYIAKKIKPDAVEIVGLCTDICVITNALIIKTLMPEVPVLVDSNC